MRVILGARQQDMYGICILYVYLCMIQIRHILMYTYVTLYACIDFVVLGFLQSTLAYSPQNQLYSAL